jgi:hypothetical protein
MGLDVKEWAMRWVEGSILSCVRGRTSLNMVVGRIRRALNSYSLKIEEILALIDTVEISPVYLPSLSREEKVARLKPIKEAVMGLQGELHPQTKEHHERGGNVNASISKV